jgi:hypothetical protein
MTMEAPPFLKSSLIGKEELLWLGQPDPAAMFAPYDRVLIPVSIIWTAFAMLWEASILGFFGAERAPLTFSLVGVPVVLIGLYFILGRYLFKAFKKRRTWYAVTSLRVVVLERVFRARVTSGFLKTLPTTTLIPGRGGRASLVFGALHFPGAFMMNSGLDLFPRAATGIVSFFDVAGAEAQTVQALVDARRSPAA